MLKIQLALDRLTRERSLQLIEATADSIDIIEVGTGVIKEYGMGIVKEIKNKYAHLSVLADMKTCDAGKAESIQAFEAGADITTVMAFADDQTIASTLEVAQDYGKRVMVDLLNVTSKKRVEELVNLGCNLFCIHFGKDMQEQGDANFEELFQLIEGFTDIDVAIAGGINVELAKELKDAPIDILIVGSAITAHDQPKVISEQIKEQII